MVKSSFRGITFTDSDVINVEEWKAPGEYNPYNTRPFLLHDHGVVLCVVFADSLQDALDAAVDADKLDCFAISTDDMKEYLVGPDEEVGPLYEGITYLGNASEPFDIESLGVEEMPNPTRSFCAQWNACQ